jgi:hypothetical protein
VIEEGDKLRLRIIDAEANPRQTLSPASTAVERVNS